VKLILIVQPLYALMVLPAQASEALKSWGLVPVMCMLAMVKALGPRVTMWRARAALVV
jgi:chorismate mutase